MKTFFRKIFAKLTKINKNIALIAISVIAVMLVGVFVLSDLGYAIPVKNPFIKGPSDQEIANAAIKYINDNQLSQTPASLVSVSEESGLMKVRIKIGTQEFDSYASKDGKLLFPQAFNMSQ